MSTDHQGSTEPHSHGPGVTHSHGGSHAHTHHAHDYEVPELPESVDIFDTILRDGSQQEGLSLTVADKLRVAEQLDHLGVTFIEGGWPGANPKDIEFFERARQELVLSTATLNCGAPARKVVASRCRPDCALPSATTVLARLWRRS